MSKRTKRKTVQEEGSSKKNLEKTEENDDDDEEDKSFDTGKSKILKGLERIHCVVEFFTRFHRIICHCYGRCTGSRR